MTSIAERVWIDELKLRDDAFDRHLAAAVVDARNRMMRVGRRATDGNQRGEDRPPLIRRFYRECFCLLFRPVHGELQNAEEISNSPTHRIAGSNILLGRDLAEDSRHREARAQDSCAIRTSN